ncbi:MAG: hypothetical protein IKO41_00480 [Lachnospiraceae bacterium]|nr:hypothetical protein [Lachnospiraceae bacterium]
MASFVLSEIGKLDQKGACATCPSAMWQIYENTTDRSVGFIDSSSMMFENRRVRLACWCTVLHKFVQSMIPLCDGNSPEEAEGEEEAEENGQAEHGEAEKVSGENSPFSEEGEENPDLDLENEAKDLL